MVPFLRKNAAYVGWVIVIFFGATLLSSSFFLGGNTEQKEQISEMDIKNAIALVDGVPLDARRFQTYYNQFVSQVDFNKTGGRISPEVMEMILYNASMKAIQDMAILDHAEANNMVIAKHEIKQATQGAIRQYGLKNKRELKKKLKEVKMPFSTFREEIKQNVMIQKHTKQLQDLVVVTDQDVDNLYVKAKVRHILVKATHLEEYDRELMAQQLYALLQKELSFEDAVLKYSEDPQTRENGGHLGWIQYGQVLPEIEEVAFGLAVKQISRPIKTAYGYHIIQVLDRQELPKPKTIDYDVARKQLIDQKKKTVITTLLQSLIRQDKIKFQWPLLKAHHAKRNGDITTAETAYQLLISQQPFSAVPHYLLCNLYLMSDQIKRATKELEKAQVKIDIDATQAFPELYIVAAEIYQKNKNIKAMNTAYDTAFKLAESTHLIALNELKRHFQKNKDSRRLKKVKSAISILEKQHKAAAEAKKKELEAQLAKEAGLTDDENIQDI